MKLDGYSFGPFAALDASSLRARLVALANSCRLITDAADAARRDLTTEEDGRLQDLIFQSESIESLLAHMEGEGEYTPRRGVGRRSTAQGPDGTDYRVDAPRGRRETPSTEAPLLLGKTREGRDILGYKPGQPLPVSGPPLDYDLGQWARAAFNGDWQSIRAQTQTEGVGTDSGFLVPPRLSQQVMEFIRNQTAVIRAGAVTVPMDSTGLSFARQISDPTFGYRGELQALPASGITFDMVNLRSHVIGCTVTLSEEAIQDAPNLTQILQTALSERMALAFDESFLIGDGVGKPLGVLVASGTQSVASIGTLTSIGKRYTVVSEAWAKLLSSNFRPTGLLYNGLTAGQFDGLIDGEDNPLRTPESWSTFPKFVTNQLPVVGGVSTAILADWSQYLIGIRMPVRIEFDRSSTTNSIPAFSNLAVHVRCWARFDGLPVRPSAFVLLPGISTP